MPGAAGAHRRAKADVRHAEVLAEEHGGALEGADVPVEGVLVQLPGPHVFLALHEAEALAPAAAAGARGSIFG